MAYSSNKLSRDGGADAASLNTSDDISDVTLPGNGGLRKNDEKSVEKTLKFRFIRKSNTTAVHPSKIHLHWIQTVQECMGKEVTIMTNKNTVMSRVDTLTWTETQHEKYYNLHTDNEGKDNHSRSNKTRDTSTFIVHRIRSTVSLQEIKSIPKVHELLRKHNCFLTEHRWTEDVWNTTQLGFIQGLDPQYYDIAHATSKVATEVKRHFPAKTKLPKFHLAYCTPKITFKGKELRTKAYAIETEKCTSTDMMKILKSVYRISTEFTSFQMRAKHPEAFARIIRRQTDTISNNHVIILNNMSEDTMYYLSDRILSVEGVLDVIRVKNSEHLGKYKILVHKDEFQKVRKTLLASLHSWFESHVPDDAKPSADTYPGPPEVAPLYSDENSSGEETYLSASVNSAMSYASVLSDWTFTDKSSPPDDNSTGTANSKSPPTVPTWSDRVQGLSTKQNSVANTTPTVTTPSQITIDEELISDLASSRAEVDDLRRKVHNLEEDKAKQQKDMEVRAKQQKRELELHAAEQKLEFEKQAEAQRKELERKMEDQRKQLEAQSAEKQAELEAKFDRQITQALQQHLAMNPPPAVQPSPDYTRMFENHDRQIQILTTMISQMIQPPILSQTTIAGKRSAVIDLTVETDEMYGIHTANATPARDDRKRPDLRQTPNKLPPKADDEHSPAASHRRRHSSPRSLCVPDNVASPLSPYQSPHPSEFYHEYDMDSPMRYTDPRHPLHPGPEDDDSAVREDRSTSVPPEIHALYTQTGVLNDELLSPAHIQDIHSQHKRFSDSEQSMKQEDTLQEMRDSSFEDSDIGDKKRPAQATPVEMFTTQEYHV
jgi:hypothetical protein